MLVSGQNPPPSAERLEWPIRATRADWKSHAGRYRDLPDTIRTALEAIQPYQAQYPEWNSLGILHDLARIDRHRSPHGLGLYLCHVRLGVDRSQIEVVQVGRPGIIDDGDEIVRVHLAAGSVLAPDNFDLDVEFDVDVTTVRDHPGPSGQFGRPWGGLDMRLHALTKAVVEYTNELLAMANDHAAEPI